MNDVNLFINNKEYTFSLEGSPNFQYGEQVLLSDKDHDITFNQDWYEKGHESKNFLTDTEFDELKNGLTRSIEKIISEELNISTDGFELEKYHHFVKTNEQHFSIVRKTRDLFPEDFSFPIMKMLPKLGQILGFELTDVQPRTNEKVHIIVRVNRPFSNDFNPPHKDIYEAYDQHSYIPQFINMWIPICGVTENSSLPIAPYSHLLTEDKILRTIDGGVVEGNKYRVRMVKEWDGSNELIRAKVNYGEVLLFSSHLVHGLAINEEKDTTRVSLEFRLFKATNE